MRARIIISILAFVASQAVAQDLAYPNQTAPFHLILLSKRSILNRSALSACHEGAGIEGLCVSSSFDPPLRGETYSLNYSSYQRQSINSSLGVNGLLTWNLPTILNGQPTNISSGLQLLSNPASNVGMLLFFPGDNGISVGFDQHDLMYIVGYQDDTVNPPKDLSAPKPYYRWYACTTNWMGYVYQTLAWVYGPHDPENPSCHKVDVLRVFV